MTTRYRSATLGRLAVLILCLSTVSIAPLLAQEAPSGDGEILSPDARLETLFEGASFTEGPAVAPDGSVYFSDITFTHLFNMQAGHIWRYNPKTGTATIYRSPSGMSNGIKFDAQGRMLVAEGADFGGRRVTRTDLATGKSEIIAGLFEGRPFNAPNDITIDEQGRIYFSDPRYLGHEPLDQPVFGVYRIDTDGSIHRIITDAGKPNGVAVSPDQKSLYVVSNDNGHMGIGRIADDAPVHRGRMALLAYDLSPAGEATFREELVNYAPQDGPDGLVCDAEGNLYVAVRDTSRYGIAVYSPAGEERAFIPTAELPTNVAFGRGINGNILYVSAGGGLYRITVQKMGYHLPVE